MHQNVKSNPSSQTLTEIRNSFELDTYFIKTVKSCLISMKAIFSSHPHGSSQISVFVGNLNHVSYVSWQISITTGTELKAHTPQHLWPGVAWGKQWQMYNMHADTVHVGTRRNKRRRKKCRRKTKVSFLEFRISCNLNYFRNSNHYLWKQQYFLVALINLAWENRKRLKKIKMGF